MIVLFGGTTEGRQLCEFLTKKRIPALVCVATEYGAGLLPESVKVNVGRLDAEQMAGLLQAEQPRLVIDATHPYAAEASGNIQAACDSVNMKRIRIIRERCDTSGCIIFNTIGELADWLRNTDGTAYSTLGSKNADALAEFGERVVQRRELRSFSEAENLKLFSAANAHILLTKETGRTGGFDEKVSAARKLGMVVAVLDRPAQEDGLTLTELKNLVEDGAL